MTQENTAPNASKKPRIVRVVSDDTLEAWESQRADYLKAHPEEAAKPIKNELVREALGMPEEEKEEDAPKEKPEEKESPEANEEDAAEKAVASDHESEDERDLEEEKEETEEETEEEKKEKTEERKGGKKEEEKTEEEGGKKEETEATGEESRVEVEKPAEEEKRKPKIRMITEPVIKREGSETGEAKETQKPKQSKPRLVEKFEDQAARDILPSSPEPGTPMTMTEAHPTLGEASKEVRVEEARRIWLQRQEEKKKNVGFFGKIKAKLGFQ